MAELAAAVDVLLLCLRDDADIADLLEHRRLLDGLRPGSVVVNHGTGDPGANVALGEPFAAHGVAYLDAPVSGGGPGARARTLTTFVGGDPEAFQRCRPVFETFSRTAVHLGPVGTGQLTKLLNNAMTMSNLKNAAEMLRIASALKLDIKALVRAISVSSGASFMLSAGHRDHPGHRRAPTMPDAQGHHALRRRGAGTGDRPPTSFATGAWPARRAWSRR